MCKKKLCFVLYCRCVCEIGTCGVGLLPGCVGFRTSLLALDSCLCLVTSPPEQWLFTRICICITILIMITIIIISNSAFLYCLLTHTLTHTRTHTHTHINTHDGFSFGVTVGVFGVVFLVRYAVSKAKPNKNKNHHHHFLVITCFV